MRRPSGTEDYSAKGAAAAGLPRLRLYFLSGPETGCHCHYSLGKRSGLGTAGDRTRLWALGGSRRLCGCGRTVEDAVVREVREEVFFKVRINRLLNIYSYPGRTTVIVAYVAEVISGRPGGGDETLEARIFRPDEIPWKEIAFTSTRDALRDYLSINV